MNFPPPSVPHCLPRAPPPHPEPHTHTPTPWEGSGGGGQCAGVPPGVGGWAVLEGRRSYRYQLLTRLCHEALSGLIGVCPATRNVLPRFPHCSLVNYWSFQSCPTRPLRNYIYSLSFFCFSPNSSAVSSVIISHVSSDIIVSHASSVTVAREFCHSHVSVVMVSHVSSIMVSHVSSVMVSHVCHGFAREFCHGFAREFCHGFARKFCHGFAREFCHVRVSSVMVLHGSSVMVSHVGSIICA